MRGASTYIRCGAFAVLLAHSACGLKLPFAHPSLSPFRAYEQRPSTGTVTATFLGTSSVLFSDDKTTLLSDPFVTRPRATAVAAHRIEPDATLIDQTLEYLGVRKIDAIFTGHTHYDHAMDAAKFAQQTGAVLLGSSSTENLGRGAEPPSIRVDVVHDSDTRRYGDFELTFIESQHSPDGLYSGDIVAPLKPPARASEWKMGKTWSVLIRHRDRSLLFHGSANVPAKQGALDGRYADVVYLGIGRLGKQSDDFVEKYWIDVVRATRARRVILIHWDDFFRGLDKPLRPMAYALDSFPDSMRRILRCATTDGVEVLLPVAWQTADPFAGLSTVPRTVAATAPHPCRESVRASRQR